MTIAILGVDLGKTNCSVAGVDDTGRVVLRRRVHRQSIAALAARWPECMVAMVTLPLCASGS